MDWKYILSLNIDKLSDEEKDELFNTVTWFNINEEELSARRYKALLRISQEVLKYKGDQVEALLHELDEIATKQGEYEAKKLEDTDTEQKSTRSKKSSSIEFENLEQKYLDLKNKYKKQVKTNEKNSSEINKLANAIKNLERENKQLKHDLQHKSDGSESDVSETIKDQHKELIETIHNKNRQISNLLSDIEETERENNVLREKLDAVKDELSEATKEISLLSERIEAGQVKFEESLETIKGLTGQLEAKEELLQDFKRDKDSIEKQMEEFAQEISKRIDEWKKVLDEKDLEIKELKAKNKEGSLGSSLSSLPVDEDLDRSYVAALNKALHEREKQLMEVQIQLQQATKEIEEGTEILQKLKGEKDKDKNKIAQLSEAVKDLKKQLKGSHERSQDLQEEVTYLEKSLEEKEEELNEIIDKIDKDGHSELANKLKHLKQLKSENQFQEKKIASLVKTCNKLQDCCNQFEQENLILRDRLGIEEDEVITSVGLVSKQKKKQKDIDKMKKDVIKVEEENIELKTEIHRLNKKLSLLSEQLYDGKGPIGLDSEESKVLIEENEALRKGMHEILNSINVKKASSAKEIKSETLEKLLRALDVRHVSGWYHPAMRLQAEVHNVEGINIELREQLRLARAEIEQYKKKLNEGNNFQENISKDEENFITIDLPQNTEVNSNEEIEEGSIDVNLAKLKKSLMVNELTSSTLQALIKQVDKLNEKYLDERLAWQETLRDKVGKMEEMQEQLNLTEEKLKIISSTATDDEKTLQLLEVTENNLKSKRKVRHLEEQVNMLSESKQSIEKLFKDAEVEFKETINKAKIENHNLAEDIKLLQDKLEISIGPDTYKNIKNDLNKTILLNRELMKSLKEREEEQSLEMKVLIETKTSLEKDKEELKQKLTDAMVKINSLSDLNLPIDERVEKMSRKVSELESCEIVERQRANHTNNLYELVREQLNKSEEKFKEFSKYNEEIVQKNLALQEQLKELEEKVLGFVDEKEFNNLQDKNHQLLGDLSKCRKKLEAIQKEFEILKIKKTLETRWNEEKEAELLGLRHQIVDLVSVADEKVQIAKLHSELDNCKKLIAEYKEKFDKLTEEIEEMKVIIEDQKRGLKQKSDQNEISSSAMHRKIELLKDIISKQKQQYFGCTPLSTEEKLLAKFRQINKEKHGVFMNLLDIEKIKSEIEIVKQKLQFELETVLKQQDMFSGDKEDFKLKINWIQEKKNLQLNELRYKRQAEFKEVQLKHVLQRIQLQDEEIAKLEEELMFQFKHFDFDQESPKPPNEESITDFKYKPLPKLSKSEETQTVEAVDEVDESESDRNKIASLKSELLGVKTELANRDLIIEELKSQKADLDMTVNMFKNQLSDRQSMITFYERQIMDLQSKREAQKAEASEGYSSTSVAQVQVEPEALNKNEVSSLKVAISNLQEMIASKERNILELENVLKEDRDKHSMAAAIMQEELRILNKCLSDEKQKCKDLEENLKRSKPARAAIEQYIQQVHALENHAAELRTTKSALEAQLQSSRQEAVRWRGLANERLTAMDELQETLEEQHKNELDAYKAEAEKCREEVAQLKDLASKYRSESSTLEMDIQKLIKDKDDKIHELGVLLRQSKFGNKKTLDKMDATILQKLSDSESSKEQLSKELDSLRKKFENALNKERAARDEIRELKMQLIKKPIASARSERSDRSIKEQLQKKIISLENENIQLKENLEAQIAQNESHKIKAAEDFEKWKKQKQCQQTVDKLKNKLKEKEQEMDKMQQTCSGYRHLIERLEREKCNLENRIKILKNSKAECSNNNQIEILRIENMKLMAEKQALNSKLEMSQHHSGGLGAAMLQEKLEAQERKIAVLELSSKGSLEVRAEMERLQTTLSNLQKINLRLEAENLEMKLDLEKSSKELPHLKEQIQHLENYIDVLKNEKCVQKDNVDSVPLSSDSKKVPELERTVFILKRVVEKLQVENKRLSAGKRPFTERSGSAEKLKRDFVKIKEQYNESLEKIKKLECELVSVKDRLRNFSTKPENRNVGLAEELNEVKKQLEQKTALVDKVKVLLHRAANKERILLQEIAVLKNQEAIAEEDEAEVSLDI